MQSGKEEGELIVSTTDIKKSLLPKPGKSHYDKLDEKEIEFPKPRDVFCVLTVYKLGK